MLYRDLVQYEPLDSIVQLRESARLQEAQRLVRTFVFSEGMTRQIKDLIVPNLRLDRAVDAKGLFIVGNYGTGKSHLMSVLAAVAEHAELAADLTSPAVTAALQPVVGKFKVVRMELGAVTRRLRASVVAQFQQFLAEQGTPYTFPAVNEVSNNKDSLLEAVAAFRRGHPDYGILFVLDELLDFLRAQDERALLLDLGFLRELGEVVELAPFRFVAGVQESLFDSPTFLFVASELHRVRERFEQARITRDDIAFVVAERLLRKSDAQLAVIGEHLRQFTALYPQLGDRLPEYARLFPIHPAYIETLERVLIAEKRQVLQTLMAAMQSVLDQPLPPQEAGLISYDHYWQAILDDGSLRAQPGVADVVTKSNVVLNRVENAYTRRNLLPLARRILAALSVQRLTTSDINAPIGVTVAELRDGLCLWAPLPEADAQFLADTVQVALREIMRTVSGQYLAFNDENGQYYLDLKKDIDFDANIARRGEFLSRGDLNPFFFDALRRVFTGLPSSVYVSGYRIWAYELPWASRQVTRPGYIFFGWPDERSTAQPPRDFYLYFLPPFKEPGAAGVTSGATPGAGEQDDEVIFDLAGLGEDFEGVMRAYAGARLMAQDSPAHAHTYEDKADEHLRGLLRWLRANLPARLRITQGGVTRTVAETLSSLRSTQSQDVEEMLRLIAAHLLAPSFATSYPDYPAFTRLREPISEAARPTAAADAVRCLAAGGARNRTNLALGVLEGLQLIDADEAIRTAASPYARFLLDTLAAKEGGQVVNRGEVIAQVAGGLRPVCKATQFALEPEWVAVTLVALAYEGQIEVSLGGSQTLDAATVERAATYALADLADFRFYRRPRGLPLAEWQQIFSGLGLPPALVREEGSRADAVVRLQERVQAELAVVTAQLAAVSGGLRLWNAALFTDRMEFASQGGSVVGHSQVGTASLAQADLLPNLRLAKEFLEKLARFNTPGKLQNLLLGAAEIAQALAARQAIAHVAALLDALRELQPAAAYLAEAQSVLPDGDAWASRAEQARCELLDALRRRARGEGALAPHEWRGRLEELKTAYRAHYSALHAEHVLGPAGDDRRLRLMRSPQRQQLRTLAAIDLFRASELDGWDAAVAGLPTCREFHQGLLADAPVCPHCRFRPLAGGSQPAEARLQALDAQLDRLLAQWHGGLAAALASPTAQASTARMTERERRPIDHYLQLADPGAGPLPDKLAESVNRALRGLQTVIVQHDDLLAALRAGGLPCTLEDLQQRFGSYLGGLMHGHDAGNTRLTIE